MLIEHNYRNMKRPKLEKRRTVGEITNWKKTFREVKGEITGVVPLPHLGEVKQYKSHGNFQGFPLL